jgi:acetate kinase
VEYFCYQTRKWIGAYAAVLNGLDTLVFSGGIGENSPALRARMCGELGYLGIQIDPRRNRRNSAIISKAASRVTVRVIQTDEEIYIAQRLQEAFL